MGIRFLHTADWQIGMGHESLGEAAGTLRRARLAAVEGLLAIARERSADLVIVAGDVFESNAVSPDVVRGLLSLIERADGPPVLLLPGNHDPLQPGSVYRSRAWRPPPSVRLLDTAEPLMIAGAEFLPCPCVAKHSRKDPTRWIPERAHAGAGPIRVGVAHGCWTLVPDIGEEDHPIAPEAATRADLDYLALGHWHGRWPEPDGPDADRTFYPGSPEPTRFGETRSGGALWVEIDAAGSTPRVEVVPTAVNDWREMPREVGADEDIEAIRAEIASLSDPERIVMRLRISGGLGAPGFESLDELEAFAADRFLAFRLDRRDLTLLTGEPRDWVTGKGGYVEAAAEELLTAAADGNATARRALRLLHRFVTEEDS
jgi:DNA repair exonuclease SbcCD nuclease subunit